MAEREDLAEHLRFYGEIGVDGFSRDRAWRTREDGRPAPEPGVRSRTRADARDRPGACSREPGAEYDA